MHTTTQAMPGYGGGPVGAYTIAAGALLLGGLLAFLVHPVLGIGVLGLLVAPVLVLAPHHGVLALVAVLPFDAVLAFGEESAFGMTRLLGLAVVAGWVAHVLFERQAVRLAPAGWIFVAYAGFAGLSLAWAADVGTTIRALVTLAQLLLFYVMISNALRTPAEVTRALDVLLISTAGLAFLVMVETASVGGRAEFTFGGRTINPNYLAATLVFPAVAAVGLGQGSGVAGMWRLAAAVPIVLALVMTGSRGGGVALAAGLLAMAAFRPRLATTLAVGTLVTALAAGAVVPRETLLEFRDRFASADQDRLSGRMDIWRVALAMAEDRPLHGTAYGGFREAFYGYMIDTPVDPYFARLHSRGDRAAHSVYVGTLAELGVIGVGILIAGLAVHGRGLLQASRTALRVRHAPARRLTLGLIGVFASLVVFGGSIDLLATKNAWVLLALMHAVVLQAGATGRPLA
jgi:O-antigen ligase